MSFSVRFPPISSETDQWAWEIENITGSPLHRSLQVSHLQRCACASHWRQVGGKLQLALRLLLLVTLQLFRLPPPLHPPGSNLLTQSQPLFSSRWTVITPLLKGRGCKIRNGSCLLFMRCLCENYYNPTTAQYCVADCVSSVPRLTCWTFECTHYGGLTVFNVGCFPLRVETAFAKG